MEYEYPSTPEYSLSPDALDALLTVALRWPEMRSLLLSLLAAAGCALTEDLCRTPAGDVVSAVVSTRHPPEHRCRRVLRRCVARQVVQRWSIW